MYQVDAHDIVIKLRSVPQSEIGAPLPLVIADDNRLILEYLISAPDPNWDGTYVNVVDSSSEGAVAIVRFQRPYAHFFGPPNDEAFEGHPLAARGLSPYAAFEIENSSWIRQLERANAVHPYHNRERFMEAKRHFVFAFHDSTFECVAAHFNVSTHQGSILSLLDRVAQMLEEDPV